MTKKLSIIIPIFNQWTYTKNCIQHLVKLNQDDYSIIVVDNGSTDETETNMRKFAQDFNHIIYLRKDTNTGFGAAVNSGYTMADAQYVMILNNDIKFSVDINSWIDNFVADMSKYEDCLVGPTGGYVDPKKGFEFAYETNDPNKLINYMSGWCLTASKKTWEKLIPYGLSGPFNSNFFFLYYEDNHLSFSAAEKGIKFVIYPLPLTHFKHKTAQKYNMNKYYNQSRKIFLEKWKHKLEK